ncbi:hypothetical protein [Pseudoalteromonas sp. '520P1 No. 423']|uniref:hypothetical protein n=1 Tax=Pseudoalteromonas sp. '520P1 No. 423' TaxID=1690037 RepID=UPI000AC3E93C|nr:hypothetical protein [Pseudoalteromonas sp. '520P1 No. 423']
MIKKLSLYKILFLQAKCIVGVDCFLKRLSSFISDFDIAIRFNLSCLSNVMAIASEFL